MSEPVQYDPEKVIILVGGHLVRPFGEAKMITIEYDEDRRSLRKSVDGEARGEETERKILEGEEVE